MEKIKTKEELDSVLSNNEEKLVCVKFGAEWCNPCKMVSTIIKRIEDDLSDVVTFYDIDVDESDDLCEEYKIMSVPTIFYFKGGLQVDKTIGSFTEQQLRDKINENNKK